MMHDVAHAIDNGAHGTLSENWASLSGGCLSRPTIRLDHVSHSMIEGSTEKRMLAPLNRVFANGQFHVVTGPSGAGKTTLLSILSNTVRPTQGCVHWGNVNLTGLDLIAQANWRRLHLGMIFQTSRLVSFMSVRDHITLAARIRGDDKALSEGMILLEALGMSARLDALAVQLSGGEKQRVAIAQALCARPAVVLADEPTAALDHDNARLVVATLRGFAATHDATVICVSHDRVAIDHADAIIALERP
jgi:putative ABC transport system ATP-binding protein